jgi:hypothetical protein
LDELDALSRTRGRNRERAIGDLQTGGDQSPSGQQAGLGEGSGHSVPAREPQYRRGVFQGPAGAAVLLGHRDERKVRVLQRFPRVGGRYFFVRLREQARRILDQFPA